MKLRAVIHSCSNEQVARAALISTRKSAQTEVISQGQKRRDISVPYAPRTADEALRGSCLRLIAVASVSS
jgi:hypothetical protein